MLLIFLQRTVHLCLYIARTFCWNLTLLTGTNIRNFFNWTKAILKTKILYILFKSVWKYRLLTRGVSYQDKSHLSFFSNRTVLKTVHSRTWHVITKSQCNFVNTCFNYIPHIIILTMPTWYWSNTTVKICCVSVCACSK